MAINNTPNAAVAQQEPKKVILTSVKCPTCGYPIKFEKGEEEVVCLACGNSYKVNTELNANINNQQVPAANNTVTIAGIQNASSALAYIEQFLDSYDWEAFCYDIDLTITELDKIVEDIKVKSSNDYVTWVCAFKTTVIPVCRKIEHLKVFYEDLIKEYKEDNLDSFSMYDSYKRVALDLANNLDFVKEKAQSIINYATKYGIPEDEKNLLTKEIENLKLENIDSTIFDTIEDIPEVIVYKEEKERAIVEEYASKNLDAPQLYNQAILFMDEKRYVEALDNLYLIKNYKDSLKYIEQIHNIFVIPNRIISINDEFIYDIVVTALLEKMGDKLNPTPVVNDIKSIVANYADTLYYITLQGKLKAINLSTKKIVLNQNSTFDPYLYHVNKEIGAMYLVKKETTNSQTSCSISRLNFKDKKAQMNIILNGIENVLLFKDNYVIYNVSDKKEKKTIIYRLDTNLVYELPRIRLGNIEFFADNALYTVMDPIKGNMQLWVYNFITRENRLIEKNIHGKFRLIDGHIFYFISDNRGINHLITINKDGSSRRELSTYVADVAFIRGGWVYCTVKFKHNYALYKIKLDGSNKHFIVLDAKRLLKLENGYLYYIDIDDNLHKTRMDGSKNTILCYGADRVLRVSNNEVIYSAVERYNALGYKSIFSNKLTEEGIRKLAYQVEDLNIVGNFVYCIKTHVSEFKDMNGNLQLRPTNRYLYKINLDNYNDYELIELIKHQPKSYAALIIIIIIAFILLIALANS